MGGLLSCRLILSCLRCLAICKVKHGFYTTAFLPRFLMLGIGKQLLLTYSILLIVKGL